MKINNKLINNILINNKLISNKPVNTNKASQHTDNKVNINNHLQLQVNQLHQVLHRVIFYLLYYKDYSYSLNVVCISQNI